MRIYNFIRIIILVTGQLWFNAIAQTTTPKEKTFTTDMSEKKTPPMNPGHIHLTDKGRQKFIGKWAYKNNDTAFIIQLKDTLETLGNNFTVETLTGKYDYLIHDIPAPLWSIKNILSGSTYGEASTAEISITNSFNKDSFQNPARYTITYIDKNTLKFEFSKRRREWYPNKNEMNLPVNIVLHKQ
ncbi:MAG: hypothetical protein EOP47_19445 [Sphingobacteriaceae bacterium]|nr:MAG: hypothetical protein EOP47_19445 [Sphingobacteriaceae bacterium]